MRKDWHDRSWDDYLYWQTQDRKTLKKINSLIKEIERSADGRVGHAELLKGDLSGWASTEIDQKNRLIYRRKDDVIQILSCRGHYSDK